MTDTFRALCVELLSALEREGYAHWVNGPDEDDLCLRARAALAEADEPAVPVPPADGEVEELPPRPPLMAPPADPALERYGITWDGSPAKPLLTRMADGYWTPWHVAAELLQRQALVPVSVSERLPGPEDCDDQGRCWWLVPHQSWPCLYLMSTDSKIAAAVATHWLPAPTLPLPEVSK